MTMFLWSRRHHRVQQSEVSASRRCQTAKLCWMGATTPDDPSSSAMSGKRTRGDRMTAQKLFQMEDQDETEDRGGRSIARQLHDSMRALGESFRSMSSSRAGRYSRHSSEGGDEEQEEGEEEEEEEEEDDVSQRDASRASDASGASDVSGASNGTGS
jgi:hypothetical protein